MCITIGLSWPSVGFAEKISAPKVTNAELSECNASIGRQALQRKALQADLQRGGVKASSTYAVLELTSAGWGGYHYSYLWLDERGDGRLVTDMAKSKWGVRKEQRFPAGELVEALKGVPSATRGIGNSSNGKVDDGLCFYVTLKTSGTVHKFVAYAPNRGPSATAHAERIIDRALNVIEKYADGLTN
jgi:hypothetical protein